VVRVLFAVPDAWHTIGMELQANSSPSVRPPPPRKPRGRSRISNTDLLPLADQRSTSARRHRDLVRAFTADAGGADNLTEAKRQLIRGAAALAFATETLEARAVAGGLPESRRRPTASPCTLKRRSTAISLRCARRSMTRRRCYVFSRKICRPRGAC
jgi:hypothetical protein